MVQPWLDAGIRAVTVDTQDPVNMHPLRIHMKADVRAFTPDPSPLIVFAFPPCTDLAVSGARWYRDKGLRGLIRALEIVEACRAICDDSGAPYMIENPVGTLSTYWREPDYAFDPCDYGDPYTKRTLLWTGGGFVMPPVVKPGDMFGAPTWVPPTEGSKMHKLPPGPERANLRSETPKGFARAVFNANRAHVMEAA